MGHLSLPRRTGRNSWGYWIWVALVCAAPLSAQDAATNARMAAFESGLVAPPDQGAGTTIQQRMDHYGVPGVSVAVIRDGKVSWAKGYGVQQAGGTDPIDTETVFSVGSVSKVGAAATTLRLVDMGRLELDRDVDEYLTSWHVPESAFTRDAKVTLRAILSHTAGLTVHGFGDYLPGRELPTTVEILNGDGPAMSPPVFVDIPIGSQFRYSGGGVTVEQLMIEDVTKMPFPEAARRFVFDPLGMDRSTYVNPLPESHGNIAKAHDATGAPTALPRGYEAMPETAASGLWTTPSDYAKLVIALIESHQGTSGAFLSPSLAQDMMTEVAPSSYGLGPNLHGSGETRRFHHGGANNSYRAWMEGHLETGNGVIVFTNGTLGGTLTYEIAVAVGKAEGWPVGAAGRPDAD
jgi:CubicO group peptidase (beta-lactamase class C family)